MWCRERRPTLFCHCIFLKFKQWSWLQEIFEKVWDKTTAKLLSSRQLFGMITGLRCLPEEQVPSVGIFFLTPLSWQLVATAHASKAYDCGVISLRRMISSTETEAIKFFHSFHILLSPVGSQFYYEKDGCAKSDESEKFQAFDPPPHFRKFMLQFFSNGYCRMYARR